MVRTMSSPQGNRIQLDGQEVINLASNNYLGLANNPSVIGAAKEALEKYGLGPGAGRNIAGNFSVHNELEQKLAAYKHVEAALVFNSGWSANLGVIPTLAGKGDAIFSDELNHGSIIDGCRLSGAAVKVYRHSDMASLEERLKEFDAPKKLIVTDAVFSMDGDVANLPEMVKLAKKYGAMLMVDDAHGDGVMGPHGRGTAAHFGLEGQIDIESGSLSKAFGAAGGFIAGSREIIEAARLKARSFIMTSSPLPPAVTAATIKSLDILSEDDSRLTRLWANRELFASQMAAAGFQLGSGETPIVPVYLGDEATAQEFSAKLFENGVFAQAIVFPLVARGRARIRVILSAAHTEKDMEEAVSAFIKVGKEMEII